MSVFDIGLEDALEVFLGRRPREVAGDGVGLVVEALGAAELGVPAVVAAAPGQHPGEAACHVVERPADDDVVVERHVKCDEDCAVADA